jgi:hypothetical protein
VIQIIHSTPSASSHQRSLTGSRCGGRAGSGLRGGGGDAATGGGAAAGAAGGSGVTGTNGGAAGFAIDTAGLAAMSFGRGRPLPWLMPQ